jgi:hypothetical protein
VVLSLYTGTPANPGTHVLMDSAYGGAAVAVWAAGSAEVTNSNTQSASSGDDKDVTISYTGNAALASGSYWDTLTFTIAAK